MRPRVNRQHCSVRGWLLTGVDPAIEGLFEYDFERRKLAG